MFLNGTRNALLATLVVGTAYDQTLHRSCRRQLTHSRRLSRKDSMPCCYERFLIAVTATAALSWSIDADAEMWRGLRVDHESRCSQYQSSQYSYPQPVEVRIIESLGGIWSPYTGRGFAHRRDTDIEHIVARSEAHDSGLCAASTNTRRQFSRDLLNLTLASPSVNRYQKRDHDGGCPTDC